VLVGVAGPAGLAAELAGLVGVAGLTELARLVGAPTGPVGVAAELAALGTRLAEAATRLAGRADGAAVLLRCGPRLAGFDAALVESGAHGGSPAARDGACGGTAGGAAVPDAAERARLAVTPAERRLSVSVSAVPVPPTSATEASTTDAVKNPWALRPPGSGVGPGVGSGEGGNTALMARLLDRPAVTADLPPSAARAYRQ
jgi:hypothetical protein